MIDGFIHIYAINNWKEIVSNQISKMKKSGLWNEISTLFIGIIGEEKFNIVHDDRIEIYKGKSTDYESLTLGLVKTIAEISDSQFFYIHTKGVSHLSKSRGKVKAQSDWREMMEYYIIERYKSCLRELKTCDIVGINWHLGDEYMNASAKTCGGITPTPHFSGNFWWTNSEYIRKLPSILPIRNKYECEFWIGKGRPRVAELLHTGVYHHRKEYPRNLYENKEEIKYYDYR